MIKVYRNSIKLKLEGTKVVNSVKVFSVFKTDMKIMVKEKKYNYFI